MLSDKQIDDLERLIVFGTMDDLPLILSRAIPVLFAELRLVRATLDSRVNDFLQGGLPSDLPEAATDYEGTDRAGQTGVPEGGQPVGLDNQVPGHSANADSVVDRGHSPQPQGSGEGKVVRKRGRPKGSRNKKRVDARDGQQAVGGEVQPDSSGDAGLLPIENPESHGREGRLN